MLTKGLRNEKESCYRAVGIPYQVACQKMLIDAKIPRMWFTRVNASLSPCHLGSEDGKYQLVRCGQMGIGYDKRSIPILFLTRTIDRQFRHIGFNLMV